MQPLIFFTLPQMEWCLLSLTLQLTHTLKDYNIEYTVGSSAHCSPLLLQLLSSSLEKVSNVFPIYCGHRLERQIGETT